MEAKYKNDPVLKYSQELITKSYFVNRFHRMSTSFLFWQIQDIAWEHAEKLGLGFDDLREKQQFWVLSRLYIKIKRRPQWGEKFRIETWPCGQDKLLALRDIRFTDIEGNDIVNASTSWLVLDARSKRIVRLNFEEIPCVYERAVDRNAERIPEIESNEELVFTPVLFNEIDVNQHFNSGRYLERIIDSYNFDFHRQFELEGLEVNFVREGLETDYLAVKRQILDKNLHICSVVRQSDGAELIRARLWWRTRS